MQAVAKVSEVQAVALSGHLTHELVATMNEYPAIQAYPETALRAVVH